MARSVFGVSYKDLEHPGYFHSVDWHGKLRGGWMRVFKSETGCEWHLNDRKLDKLAYEAIMEKFRLVKLISELTIEGVQFMSPAALVKYRNAKGLPTIDIFSDTPGDTGARAEEYE